MRSSILLFTLLTAWMPSAAAAGEGIAATPPMGWDRRGRRLRSRGNIGKRWALQAAIPS
jgi:hypothetical protein